MELGLHIADFTWTGGAPALGPALARHVRAAEFSIDPTSTADDMVATASAMAELGFTAAYVWAHDITEPDRIIALFAAATDRLSC